MFAGRPSDQEAATEHLIEQPRYPGTNQDRRLCVPVLLLVCLLSGELRLGWHACLEWLCIPRPDRMAGVVVAGQDGASSV